VEQLAIVNEGMGAILNTANAKRFNNCPATLLKKVVYHRYKFIIFFDCHRWL